MATRGKPLSSETLEAIVLLKRHFDTERRAGPTVSTRNPAARTASVLGIGEASVKRAMAKANRLGGLVPSRKSRGRPEHRVSLNLQPVVRSFIRTENLVGKRVSVECVRRFLAEEHRADVAKPTLARTLKRWGFVHGEGRRRSALKEQAHVVAARREYLRIKRANRNRDGTLRRPEVYLDETYINKNYSNRFTWYLGEDGPWVNKPSGVGPRLIIVNAITKDGWVNGAELVFKAKKRTGDYHGQMNWDNFSRWFTTQLIPGIPPASLIILDNASYHNVLTGRSVPAKASTKESLQAWLAHNRIPWREDMLRSELYDLCERLAPEPEFRLDQIAAKHGHTILRTPPYHPELQPIETCWGIVKNHMADNCDFTMANLRNQLPVAFSTVDATTCRKIIAKVVAEENKFWRDDEFLDDIYSQYEIEECIAENANGTLGEDPFPGDD